jgi:SPP1 gp7 family putative phage head morphogenesis protein
MIRKPKALTKEEKYWFGQIGVTEKYEANIIRKLKTFFNKQKDVVLSEFKEKSATIKVKKTPKQILNIKEETERLVLILQPDLKKLIEEEGEIAFGFIGMGGSDLDMTSPKIEEFLSAHLQKSAVSINETTISRLERVISQGIQQGEGYDDIAKRIGDVFTSASDARSMAIARTEVIKANNMASVEAYRQSGVVSGKRWLTAMDERTCEECEEMDGTIVDLDENYFDKGDKFGNQEIDFEDIEEPPLHTSCRCTTTPVMVGERQIVSNLIKKETDKAKKEISKELEKLKKEKTDLQIELDLSQKESKKDIEKKIKDISSNINKIINEK